MQPLDLQHVDQSSAITEQNHVAPADGAGIGASRHGVPTPLGDHLGPGLHHRRPVNILFNSRMLLKESQSILGIKVAVAIIQSDDDTNGNSIFRHGIHDPTAKSIGPHQRSPKRITHSVNHPGSAEFPILLRVDLEQLFNSQGVKLDTGSLQPGFVNKLFAEQAIATLGQHDKIGHDGCTGQKIALRLPLPLAPLIPQLDPSGLTGLFIPENIGGGKTVEYFHSKFDRHLS